MPYGWYAGSASKQLLHCSALADQLVATCLPSTEAGVSQGLLFLEMLYAGYLLLALLEILIWID